MNCDLVGLASSAHWKKDRIMGNLIYLGDRKLSADEARKVVRAALKKGYTDLYSVPDEFAEAVLNNGMTYQEAYAKALKAIPKDIRFVKTEEGEYERVDINERRRIAYANQILKDGGVK